VIRVKQIRTAVVAGFLLAACSSGGGETLDLSAPVDLAAGACTKNSDCPNGQLCMPPCACTVDDAGHRCDVFVASCVPTLQGFPCQVQGDHVVCCQ
jgi:hypothetical protein